MPHSHYYAHGSGFSGSACMPPAVFYMPQTAVCTAATKNTERALTGHDENMEEIKKLLAQCVRYAVEKGLCMPQDMYFVQNRLLDLFGLDSPFEGDAAVTDSLPAMLERLTDLAAQNGMLRDNTPSMREIFDNRVAGCLLMPPSQVTERFTDIREHLGMEKATAWFYEMCRNSNYIRTAQIARNICYCAPSPYGEVEITINLTKPEKDPKEIAMARSAPAGSYPACQLCVQNVGYAGRINHPPRALLRTIPITLNGEQWHFQYSPYVYFNEHCIALSEKHIPMEINRATFRRLADFQHQFPHYFIGSNAGLPIAGGSILSHLHFQGGRYILPMMRASERRQYPAPVCGVTMSVLNWPMPVLRLRSRSTEALIDAASAVTSAWEAYSDPESGIFAVTDGEKHNTVTPIMHNENGELILDIVLRNNITSPDFPLGVFHPHPCRHHIKRENIGLIEVMGLFILPGRLKSELEETAKYLAGEAFIEEKVISHKQWADSFRSKYSCLSFASAYDAVKQELAVLCMQLLGDAAVYKDDAAGHAGLDRFIASVNFSAEGRA